MSPDIGFLQLPQIYLYKFIINKIRYYKAFQIWPLKYIYLYV